MSDRPTRTTKTAAGAMVLFAVGVMTGAAAPACYPPATRAMRIDPMAALQYE